ncbi:MAG: serine/threonine-protein kinase, partial [Acidobacteria bacterium]
MPVDSWKRIEELYHAALERAPADRSRFLTQACAGNEDLRREVESFLSYDDRAAEFIETPAFELAAKQWASDARSESGDQASLLSALSEQIGAYQLLTPLAKGGMGEVYLAMDTRLKRKVAIKLMPVDSGADRERVRRFEQEALAASALNHPNILTVHEIGETEGRKYIVAEYVDGETLRERIGLRNQRIRPDEAVRIAVQIAGALDSAHAAGIIHRDIKPENVMVRPDGLVKVLDFGLAKVSLARREPEGGALERLSTQDGIVMGTAAYMSPEQARGQELDRRTDIFSLGVLLYEMLGARRPFEGPTTSDVIAAVLTHDPAPLSASCPDVSASLEGIVSRCLEKDPDKRFQSAGELRSALEAVSLLPEPKGARTWPWFSRLASRPLIIGLTLGFLILVVALISSYTNETAHPSEQADGKVSGKPGGKSIRREYGPGASFAFTVPDGWILSWSDAPAVSPDGRYIVFTALPTSAEVGREVSLWVRDLDSSQARLLPGTEGGTSPFWSPDSRFVAFWAKGMLYKVGISGEAASTVCKTGRGFAGTWSQDGIILFPALVALGSRLCRVAATGGEAVVLDSLAEGETARYDPRFLPDGRH